MTTLILRIGILYALLASACVPRAAEPEPAPSELPASSMAAVESVKTEIQATEPPGVKVIATGHLPDAGCTSIAAVEQERDSDVFRVSITTHTDPEMMCAQVLTPFEEVVLLDTNDLAPGLYRVSVNGVEGSFELPPVGRVGFDQRLVGALDARDYEDLKRMMGDDFLIGYWQSEGATYSSDEAIEQMRVSLLASDAPIRAESDRDLVALLGMDPAAILGPEVPEVSAVLVSGMGTQVGSEAILFITARPEGGWQWYGLLFAMDGFEQY